MATTNFIDYQTKIEAEWLNEVDALVWDIFGGATTDSEARTSLGLDSMALQSAASVAITGGSITGITDLAVADGGTGASTAAGARTNLGLGTASVEDVGTSTGNVVQLQDVSGSPGLPAVDGSQLTGITAGGVFVDAADGGPYISSTSFDVAANIGAAWESVGPTGSGATNIWTALDSVPASADWVEVRIRLQSIIDAGVAGTQTRNELLARKNGSSIVITNAGIAEIKQDQNGSYSNTVANITTAKIPIDGSNIFELYYLTNSVATATCFIHLVGYGSNP
jgi:hypothetical protein